MRDRQGITIVAVAITSFASGTKPLATADSRLANCRLPTADSENEKARRTDMARRARKSEQGPHMIA
jgi:hypothetical protein